MKNLILIFGVLLVGYSNAQTYLMNQGGTVSTCSGNFYDSGGSGGDYDDENDTITFCSANGFPIIIKFSSSSFSGDDHLFVYDGPNTSAIQIAELNYWVSDSITFISTGTCLTFRYYSGCCFPTPSGGWSATITCGYPPTNDDPCNAIILNVDSVGNFSSYSNQYATGSTVANPGCAGYTGGDVWFKFTVPPSGNFAINTRQGDVTDGGMAIYSGTCSSLTKIECDDNDSENDSMPRIFRNAGTPGETLWIRFWENGNNVSGSFSIYVWDFDYDNNPPSLLPNIIKAEYFIDTDPGFGLGKPVSLSPDTNVNNVTFSIDIDSIPAGYHRLFIRSKDAYGKWSLATASTFYRDAASVSPNPSKIVKAVYFIDTDAGFGTGTNISITTPAIDIDSLQKSISYTSLAPGFHILYFRAKDSIGNWSQTIIRSFYKDVNGGTLPNIVKAEYFINNDLGFDAYNNISVTPATNISNLQKIIDITGYTSGTNTAGIRAMDANGKWSETNIFCISPPVADFTADPVCSGIPVSFVNTSANTDLNTKYRWDFNNDGTTDQILTGNGNISNSSFSTGNHIVTLILENGSVCKDTIVHTVIVYPLPPASITSSTTLICQNDTVTLYANTGMALTYQWKLNSSIINGETSLVFDTTSSGTYQVVVTDTNGCEGYSNSIVINSPGIIHSLYCTKYLYNLDTVIADYIDGVKLVGTTDSIYNLSNGFNPSEPYVDNTLFYSTSLVAGNNYTLYVHNTPVVGHPGSINAWIDYNSDGDFMDTDEKLSPSQKNLNNSGIGTISFTVPSNLATLCTGERRLRIRQRPGNFALEPCQPYDYGETEDYDIQIICAAPPTINADGNTTFCQGDSVLLTATAATTYLWSNSATTQSITVFTSGNYSVEVIDTNGCVGNSSPVNVTLNPSPSATITNTNPICNGGTNGTATGAGAGGISPYTYSWSNASITQTVNGLSAGTYTVTLSDSKNCTATNNSTLLAPAVIQIDSKIITDASCEICGTGKIKVAVSGGVSPYNYSWSNGSSGKDSIINLLPNTYSLTITDANGCKKIVDSLIVSFTTDIVSNIENRVNIYPNPVRNTLTVEIENPGNSTIEIILTTMEGKQVMKEIFKDNTKGEFMKEIDMNTMADQLYIVQIKTGVETYIRKVNKLK